MKEAGDKAVPKPEPKASEYGSIERFLAQRNLSGSVDISGELEDAVETVSASSGTPYAVGRVVAEGGMGVIHEVKDLNSRRKVAMKVLGTAVAQSQEDVLRFVEEAQITSQLEHPDIVPVHELGFDCSNNIFYTMKLMRGLTLTEILLGLRHGDQKIIERFPLSRLLTIFQKSCDAMAFAHSRGVVHRDIKPDNIMVGDYGEVVLMDWGLARIVPHPEVEGAQSDAESGNRGRTIGMGIDQFVESIRNDEVGTSLKTMTGRIMGTPGFMAPEQIRLQDEAPDIRSDIYSLGATLYSILTLCPPITGKDVREILHKTLDGDIALPDISELDEKSQSLPHCPQGRIPLMLLEIAIKALSVDPEDRYGNVQELQQEVEAYQNGFIWHLVLDEDFSDPDILSRWDIRGGRHEIEDDLLRLHSGEPQMMLLNMDLPGDVRIDFECCQDGVYLNTIGCFLAATRSSNWADIPASGYKFEYGAFDNSINAITKAERKLATRNESPLVRDKWYRVRAERIGARLRFVVNNHEVFNVVDPDPLSGPDRTLVGLVGWRADTCYSRIRVYCLGVPWESDILDIAERQHQKGNYSVASVLFKDVIDSSPPRARLERARKGYEIASRRNSLTKELPVWHERLASAWPNANIKIRLDNDGLCVELPYCDVEDLSPLAGMPLTALDCAGNRITSLEPLAGMPLASLNISGNPVSDLSPLAGMPLASLICEQCAISDLEPLRGMPLTLLNFADNTVQDLLPIEGMPLNFLCCWGNDISSLEPLRGMPLMTLICSANKIADLEPLRGLRLNTLICNGNRILDLSPLKGMPLTVLHCADNEVASVEPLRGLPLTVLGCHANNIASLDALRDMELRVLMCGANRVSSLGPLARNPPQDIAFDCDTFPLVELEQLRDKWARDFRYAAHARDAEILIALRRRNVDTLRSMAHEFRGRRYLYIPRFMKWRDAAGFCETLGGHLLTIRDEEENDFVASLFPQGCWFWLGLLTDPHGHKWVTGEPVTYTNFVDLHQEKRLGPKIFIGKWSRDGVPDSHNCFMIQWDD